MRLFIHAAAGRVQPRIPEKEDLWLDEKPVVEGLSESGGVDGESSGG
jgi:hypothetical protein